MTRTGIEKNADEETSANICIYVHINSADGRIFSRNERERQTERGGNKKETEETK